MALYYFDSSNNTLPNGNIYFTTAPHIDNNGALHIWQISDNWASGNVVVLNHWMQSIESATPTLLTSQTINLLSTKTFYTPGLAKGTSDQNLIGIGHGAGNGGITLVKPDYTMQHFYSILSINAAADGFLVHGNYVYFYCAQWPQKNSFTRGNLTTGTVTNIPLPVSMQSTNPTKGIGILAGELYLIVDNKVATWNLSTLALTREVSQTLAFNGVTSNIWFGNDKAHYNRIGKVMSISTFNGVETEVSTDETGTSGSPYYPFEMLRNEDVLWLFRSSAINTKTIWRHYANAWTKPPLYISLKQFTLSKTSLKIKLDNIVSTTNVGRDIRFKTIFAPIIKVVTGENCAIPFQDIPYTVTGTAGRYTLINISLSDYTTYIGGTGKIIYVGTPFESLYEPSILYRKDNGPNQESTYLDSIRIEKIATIVENSRELGMRKSGKGIATSIEYNTSEDSLGKKWNFYFKDDLRNAKMEFIMSDHMDVQITQFIWQGQYHQITKRLGGR